jgi:hypothetical protein
LSRLQSSGEAAGVRQAAVASAWMSLAAEAGTGLVSKARIGLAVPGWERQPRLGCPCQPRQRDAGAAVRRRALGCSGAASSSGAWQPGPAEDVSHIRGTAAVQRDALPRCACPPRAGQPWMQRPGEPCRPQACRCLAVASSLEAQGRRREDCSGSRVIAWCARGACVCMVQPVQQWNAWQCSGCARFGPPWQQRRERAVFPGTAATSFAWA